MLDSRRKVEIKLGVLFALKRTFMLCLVHMVEHRLRLPHTLEDLKRPRMVNYAWLARCFQVFGVRMRILLGMAT